MEGLPSQQSPFEVSSTSTPTIPERPRNCDNEFAADCNLPGDCAKHRTTATDYRVDLIIDTLKPISPDSTPADEPRAPIRRELIERMSQVVGEPNSYVISQWVDIENRAQIARDTLIANLEHALREAEDADRDAYQNLRNIISIYDNAAKAQRVLLPTYQPPSGWGSEDDSPSPWDTNPSTGIWADDRFVYCWETECYVYIDTRPSSPIHFATILASSSTSSVTTSSPPPLQDYRLEDVD